MVGKYGRPHDGDISLGHNARHGPDICCRVSPEDMSQEMSRGYTAEHDPEICSGTRCRDMICA